MTEREDMPTTPPEGEATAPNTSGDEAPTAPEKPIDPKEEARRRSKEDLANKRRGMHRSRGKRR